MRNALVMQHNDQAYILSCYKRAIVVPRWLWHCQRNIIHEIGNGWWVTRKVDTQLQINSHILAKLWYVIIITSLLITIIIIIITVIIISSTIGFKDPSGGLKMSDNCRKRLLFKEGVVFYFCRRFRLLLLLPLPLQFTFSCGTRGLLLRWNSCLDGQASYLMYEEKVCLKTIKLKLWIPIDRRWEEKID